MKLSDYFLESNVKHPVSLRKFKSWTKEVVVMKRKMNPCFFCLFVCLFSGRLDAAIIQPPKVENIAFNIRAQLPGSQKYFPGWFKAL